MQPLAVLLRQTAVSSTAHDTALVQGVCRMLHVLISVRGYKTVVRFFPHEAADLERVLQVSCCLWVGYVPHLKPLLPQMCHACCRLRSELLTAATVCSCLRLAGPGLCDRPSSIQHHQREPRW